MLDGETSHSHKNHIGTFNDGNVKVVFMDSRRERYTQQVLCSFVKKKRKEKRKEKKYRNGCEWRRCSEIKKKKKCEFVHNLLRFSLNDRWRFCSDVILRPLGGMTRSVQARGPQTNTHTQTSRSLSCGAFVTSFGYCKVDFFFFSISLL